MRYNFKPTISPMKPCFAKGVKHTTIILTIMNASRSGFVFSEMSFYNRKGAIAYFRNEIDWIAGLLNDREGYRFPRILNIRISRTPTPWHKYQHRPARKLLNLRLSKNLNKRISIEMTMTGRVFDLSDFDVDEKNSATIVV